ncbi:MAG: hypothetical protein PVJ41_16820 [Desulfobacterales bacterium]|jgi:FtsZ-interacting cell division protein ZipA
MKLFLLILGIVVLALNVFLWYWKKRSGAADNRKSPNNQKKSNASKTDSADFLNTPAADELKQAAAAELGIPVEKLNRMSVEEIAHLAAEKGLIS